MPRPDVALGDGDDEAQVRFGELMLGELAVLDDRELAGPLLGAHRGGLEPLGGQDAGFDAAGEVDLLRRGEERDLPDLLEVHADGIEVAGLARPVTARRGPVEDGRDVAANPRRSRGGGGVAGSYRGAGPVGLGAAASMGRASSRRWASSSSSSSMISSWIAIPRASMRR